MREMDNITDWLNRDYIAIQLIKMFPLILVIVMPGMS